MNNHYLIKKSKIYSILRKLSQTSVIFVVIILAFIISFIIIKGFSNISLDFIWGEYNEVPSIKPAIIGTLILICSVLFISVPIGISTSIYLVEYTKRDSRILYFIHIANETLAGIPSIIYGLFGYLFFVVYLDIGYSLLGGCLTMTIMVLPSIISSVEESLLSVPNSYKEGSYALGAGKTKTIFKIILPCASKGIITAIILTTGRLISESAVLLLTIGMVVDRIPNGIFSSGTTLALNVYFFGNHGYPEAGEGTAFILLILVLVINLFSSSLGKIFYKGIGESH
ncbi:phosphate ABC transporter permease PstA [Fusobacterium sp. PH5-44]|uniref:phosphate ABC transporter permease PstA n=1 Tax=unclassified Fusobacterium TaxID=2648384 RepID=UPI003D19268C